MAEYKEKISLEMDAGGVKANTLSELIGQLKQVEEHILKVNAAMGGMRMGTGAARSVEELESAIQKLQRKSGAALNVGELTKGLGLEQAEFERFIARRKKSLKDYQSEMERFRSAPAAARAIAQFEREGASGRARLGDLLKPSVASVHGLTTGGGKVPLEIPASQVQASVVGTIQLNIPGGQVSGGGRDPNTGQFVGGGGGGGKSGGKGPLGNIPAGGGQTELQRVRVDTDKYLRETITAVDEAGKIIATTHDSVEGIIKTATKTPTGTKPIEQFRQARRAAEENFKQLKAAIDPNDPGYGLASLLKKQGEQLLALLQQPFMKQLGGPAQQQVRRLIEGQSLTLEARGIEAFQGAQQQGSNLYYRGMFDRFTNEMTPATGMTAEQRRNYQAWANRAFGAVRPGRGYARPIGPELPVGYSAPIGPSPADFAPPKLPRQPAAPVSPFARGLRSFTPTGFAANLLNVSGWAASVGVLYKSLEVGEYSLRRFIDIGQQTQRLSVVFRGVGGSAKELTDDVLQLAAANGRSTEEAMESATEWSRLGLSRQQVNEAVKVSLEAANVANMHAGETTKQLASLMHIYNLEVGDLSGVLGMLATTSQRYNVTLEDLFQGLDRSAGSARLARVGLAELQGFIGTVVGKTGQSGTVVGNTLKSMLVQFANPDVQQYLRRFGIETLDKNLSQKSGSQILQEMFVKWQTMDDRQKQSLTWRLVGRYSAARFVPVMDDYVQSQKMAIESQLNLNSAQEANVKIMDSVKSRLAAIRAEWDRLVNQGGAARPLTGGDSIVGRVVSGATAVGNVMRLFNGDRPGGGRDWGMPQLWSAFQRARRQRGWSVQPSDIFANLFPPTGADRRQGEQSAFEQSVQQMNSGSGAMAVRSRLLDTIAQVLPVAKGGSRQNMIDTALSQMGADGAALQQALANGDMAGAQAILRKAGQGAQAESLQQSGAALTAKTDRLATLNLASQNLNAEIEAMRAKGASQNALNEKLQEQAELQKEIKDLETDRSAAADDYAREAAAVGDVVELKQQYVNLLREQEQLMQGIDELSSQQTLGTAGARLDAQTSALASQLALMKAQKEILDERGGVEDSQAAEELRRRIADAESRKAALESPQVQAATSLFDARAIASRRAREEADSYAVGYTESEKLLNQRRSLQSTINTVSSQPFRSDNDRVRIKELEIALWQNQEKIQQRIVELAREEKQIRIDSTREFQKSLLLAGPGEQLQRLYVTSLSSRRMGSGEFNALSPELKRYYYELHGGESGAKVREEEGLLRGRGMSVEQEQAAQERSRGRVAFSGNILQHNFDYTLGKMPGMPLPPLDPLVSTGQKAAEQLTILGTSAAAASKALALLPQTINAMAKDAVRSALPPKAATTNSAPKLNVQSGFSLGAPDVSSQNEAAVTRSLINWEVTNQMQF